MKIVDLNILIYATDTQAPQHVRRAIGGKSPSMNPSQSGSHGRYYSDLFAF